jgi:hypothetical protein
MCSATAQRLVLQNFSEMFSTQYLVFPLQVINSILIIFNYLLIESYARIARYSDWATG